jgi:hypothetical protein
MALCHRLRGKQKSAVLLHLNPSWVELEIESRCGLVWNEGRTMIISAVVSVSKLRFQSGKGCHVALESVKLDPSSVGPAWANKNEPLGFNHARVYHCPS